MVTLDGLDDIKKKVSFDELRSVRKTDDAEYLALQNQDPNFRIPRNLYKGKKEQEFWNGYNGVITAFLDYYSNPHAHSGMLYGTTIDQRIQLSTDARRVYENTASLIYLSSQPKLITGNDKEPEILIGEGVRVFGKSLLNDPCKDELMKDDGKLTIKLTPEAAKDDGEFEGVIKGLNPRLSRRSLDGKMAMQLPIEIIEPYLSSLVRDNRIVLRNIDESGVPRLGMNPTEHIVIKLTRYEAPTN